MRPGEGQQGHLAYGAENVGRVGREVIDKVDTAQVSARLAGLPAAPLLADLDAILQALDASDIGRSRERTGMIGRLLGRDLVARTDPDPTESRIEVLLARAGEHAARLAAHVELLESSATDLHEHLGELDVVVERVSHGMPPQPAGSTSLAPDGAVDATRWRVSYLQAVADSWRTTCAQLDMAVRHARLVLDRHAQVRDVLVPLWRQQAAAQAINRQAVDGGAGRMVEMQDAMRHHLAILADAAPTPSASPADASAPPASPPPAQSPVQHSPGTRP